MIYLKDGNVPLNLAYDDDIVQEANSTYQLSFKFPLTDKKWKDLKKEVFILADDLHGEQEFFIFEVKKANGYVQVYAKQVATLLNYYSINTISVDMVPGQTVMTALAGSTKRTCPFTFFSDILDRHTFNESNVSVMDALVKEKHSIIGQWGGDLVRDKYQVKLLKNGGIENESLFMYKKNLSSYEESENINNLITRLHLKKTIQGQSEGETDRVIAVTVDSPLINQYSQIYETDIEVNDQDVTDEAGLLAYGQRYFSSTLCDLIENSINLDVKGKADGTVKIFDTVSVFHERFDVDLRLKITSYHFAPMSKRLKSIGFGKVSQSLKSAVASMVAGSVDKATKSFEQKLQKEIDNANQAFDAEFDKRVEVINDGIEQAKAEAELYADNIKQSIDADVNAINQSMQSQSDEHDRQVADILSKTQSVEALANQAKTDAANAMARANQVKTEAIADATEQVATVSQALNTAKTDLQNQVNAVDAKAVKVQSDANALRTDLDLQASKILEQAQAQTALTSRVTTVETLADGTKTTVTELSKTVSKATGDIASVTGRTKTVEDTLSQTRTQFESLSQTVNTQTGQIDSINRKTADLQSGIDGVTERFENLQVGGENLLLNAGFENATDSTERFTVGGVTYKNKTIPNWDNLYNWGVTNPTTSYHAIYRETFEGKGPVIEFNESDGSRKWKAISQKLRASELIFGNYTFSSDIYATGTGTRIWFGFYYFNKNGVQNFHSGQTTVNISTINKWHRVSGNIKLNDDIDLTKPVRLFIYAYNFTSNSILYLNRPKLENGTVATAFSLSQETIRSEIAEYKRTADQNYAGLQSTVSTLDGKVTQNKTEANQTATQLSNRLTSLETYKDGESTRAQAYFEASKTETAKQLATERTAISANYVAKSTYDENVSGTTLKLNEIKTTADTTKQNLATYQDTVDRKLTELTTSTQTLDGKINTASAKVDTVASQIRTEISEVKGKIPTENGGSNLIIGSMTRLPTPYQQATLVFTKNQVVQDWRATDAVRVQGTKGGNDVFCYLHANRTASTSIQNQSYVHSVFIKNIGTPIKILNNLNKTIDVTTNETKRVVINGTGDGASFLQINFLQSGTGQIDFYYWHPQIETGIIVNDWSPAPEDFINELSSVKTTVTQTASGVEQLSTSLSTTNDKVTTAETKISQLISDVSSKVSQTDYNTLTGRVSNAETAITQNATEISKRLTSTQVNQAILVGKQIKDTRRDNQSPQWYWTNYPKQTVEEFKASAVIGLTSESTYAILTTNVHWTDSSGGKVKQTAKTDRATFERYGTGTTWEAWTKIANAGDLANYTTKTEFQTVKETTSLYERVIGSTEVNVKDKIARIVMADSLFMTEVKNKVDGTSTQVTQLADSYAIKNLTNSGTVLNQLNLNKDGSIKIDGSLVQITGTTYIQDGVISAAKIGDLDAGKIKTGTLDAARIAVNSIDGSKLVFDQAFFNSFTANEAYLKQIFAKNAFITSVQAVAISASNVTTGVLRATNRALDIDLDNANITFNQNATINFNSDSNAVVRKKGDVTAFVNFADDPVSGGVYAGIGVTSHAVGVTTATNSDRGKFAGMRVYRPNDSLDLLRLIGDTITLAHGTEGKYFHFKPIQLRNNVDMTKLAGAVYTLSRIFMHLSANGWAFDHPSFIAGVKDEMARNWLQDFANEGLPR